MKYVLPKLSYAFSALEPHIDARTMEIHYTKHHQAYVDKLNEALEKYPTLVHKPIEELLVSMHMLPEEVYEAVKNHGGGHYNHSQFWLYMTPDAKSRPEGVLRVALEKQFGSLEEFKKLFKDAALKRFGSGWAWLYVGDKKELVITSTPNQESPIMEGKVPILGLDVWEHAYYLAHQNKRGDYIDAWWHVVNWDYVEKNYEKELG